jgi:hypothetical protein
MIDSGSMMVDKSTRGHYPSDARKVRRSPDRLAFAAIVCNAAGCLTGTGLYRATLPMDSTTNQRKRIKFALPGSPNDTWVRLPPIEYRVNERHFSISSDCRAVYQSGEHMASRLLRDL